MEELIKLLKRRGVYNTLIIISSFQNFRVDKHTFYHKLNEFSHYNSFIRIKDELIQKGLLEIQLNNSSCYFELTHKGQRMLYLLKELDKLLE
ncbi:MAG: hypothetical protein ACFE8B_12845 [Candidatus Hermodarchaeota archaeon]